MKKTKAELKQEALDAIERDIGEILERYYKKMEPEEPGNPRIGRIEAVWSEVRAKSYTHIVKLMNQLAEGATEEELVKKKDQVKAATVNEG
jgi:hypothetical protein